MAKLKVPLLSLSAQGRLGKAISFVRRRGKNIAEKKPVVPDAKTLAQLSWRHMFQKVVVLWHALSAAEKLEWESLARPKHMTGYAYFLSQCLRPNPGIYLPLQGGKMSGDVDMDKNRLLKLPTPVDGQEADNLTARDAAIAVHAAISAAHHPPYTDEDVAALIAIHAAIADAHHVPYSDSEADARIAIHAGISDAHHTPALAFYSETDNLSDLIHTRNRPPIPAESWQTRLDITSGGCRFLGGVIATEVTIPFGQVRITVDGGTPQTFSVSYAQIYPFTVPPIKADTSLKIEVYNSENSAISVGLDCWRRAL
ncbi:hypothetical protein ES708_22924 [subsurface metagenome]